MNNNPTITPQVINSPFKNFCMSVGAIPTSYQDSLDYYETLLWLIKFLDETVIPAVTTNGNAAAELQGFYLQLQNYVNNYFDNLDVQEEINNKLDDMVEQGKLQEIIADYLNSKAVFGFDTVANMKSSTNLIDGSYAKTLGFHSLDDGGSATYKIREITNSDVVDEMTIISIGEDNLIAELIYPVEVNPEMFGAYGDGIHDDTEPFQKAVDSGYPIKCLKSYKFNNPIVDNENKNLIIDGDRKARFINFYLIKNMNISTHNWIYPYMTNLFIKGINFTTSNDIIFSTGSQTKIEDCNFSDVNTIVAMPKNAYLDTLIMKNVVISESRTISGLSNYYIGSYNDQGNIGSTYLGDMYNFENVHMTSGTSGDTNHGRIFGYFYGQESVIFNNCLNIRAKFLQANAQFNACHFEDVSGIKNEWVSNSELTFIGCSFASDSFFVDNAKYIGCVCTCSPTSKRFYESPDVIFDQYNIPEDVDLIVNIQSGRIGNPIPLNKDGGIGMDTMNSMIDKPFDISAPAEVLNGQYTYTFNYSPVKSMIIGRNTSETKTFTTDGTKIPGFNLKNNYLQYMYGYVTRTDSNNNTVWAIVPPRRVTRYVDYGYHINGSKWNTGEPPTITNDNANVYGFKNGVVFSKAQINYYKLGLINQYSTSDRTTTTVI